MIHSKYFDAFGHRINPGQYFFGGGSKAPSKPEPVKMPEMPQVTMPTPPPAPATIPPAPTTSATEVQQAQDDTKKQAAKRNGVRKTLLAGETGGYGATNSSGTTKKTLLG